MKVKISIPGKAVIETPLLKGTQYALLKGNELHCNPDGYEGEVKIIELKEKPPAPDAFWSLYTSPFIPEGHLFVFSGKRNYNPIFP